MRDTELGIDHLPDARTTHVEKRVQGELSQGAADTDDVTGLRPAPTAEPTLSESLWGACIYEGLPMLIDPRRDLTLERGDWDRAMTFLQGFPGLREERASCLPSPAASRAKQRYFRTCCDLIEIRQGARTVGVFIGAPDDWSTYYIRLLAFDPAVSARVAIRRFFNECLTPQLRKAGVERIVGETAPTNPVMIRWFTELGCQPTGQRLTERWGPFIQFTKFIREESSRAFMHRFAPNGAVGANDNNVPPGT